VDYVFRVLGLEYLDRTDLAQVKPEDLGMVRSVEHATGRPVGFEHHRGPNGESHANGKSKESSSSGQGTEPAIAATAPSAGAAGRTAPSGSTPAPASAPRPVAGDGGQDTMLAKFPGDAPLCPSCGHITIRNGTCYRCLNCGNSLGCS
jgi:ribonucleoside-diphosphate reductase alpha chain